MKKDKSSYVFIGLFLGCIVLSFLIIKPFLTPIIAGIVGALVFYPVYNWLLRWLKRKNICALITTVIIFIVIFTPVVFLFQQVSYQAKVAYVLTKQRVTSGDLLGEDICNTQNPLCTINEYYKDLSSREDFVYQRNEAIDYFEGLLWRSTPDIVAAVPRFLLNLFLMSFVLFYILREGKGIFKRFEKVLPLKKKHKKKILKRLKNVTSAVMYGHVIAGLAQGIVGVIGLYIFNVTNPLILGAAMTFAALIPFIGTPIIWLPIALLKIADGVATGSNPILFNGIGLLLYGIFVISLIDNFVKPKIMGDRAQVNPAVILLGLLGGLVMFGLVGIFVGPLILALTMTMIDIYEADKDEITG